MLFIVSTLLIAIILILVFVFLLSYQKKIVSQKLLLKQVEMDLQQKLLIASVEAQEKERKRIASDLHDDIGSLLSALKLNVRHLKTVDKIGEEEIAFLDRTATMLDDGLTNVRRISYDLLPPSLVRFGLWVALNELVQLVHNSKQIKIKADFSEVENYRLDKNAELSILRVMQELIANSLHHASASEITIRCRRNDGLQIEYRDNGIGITNQSQLQGLGMINMQARIQTLGGKINIAGEETANFIATITVPDTKLI